MLGYPFRALVPARGTQPTLASRLPAVFHSRQQQAIINNTWAQLRDTLSVQRRVTSSLCRRDGRTIHTRKSTVAEPDLKQIYQALKLNSEPGVTKKLLSQT